MSDKKNIDRLFQERFKNFDVTPDDAVWNSISAKLNEKKKNRKIVPIWWRYAGAAAFFLLFLTVGIKYFNHSPNIIRPNPIIGNENTTRSSGPETQLLENEATQQLARDQEAVLKSNSKKTISEGTITSVAAETSYKKVKSGNATNSSLKNTSNTILDGDKTNEIAKNSEEKNENTIPNKVLKKETKADTFSIAETTSKENATVHQETSSFKNATTDIIVDNNIIADSDTSTAIVKNEDKNTTRTIEEALETNPDLIEKEKPFNRWSLTPNVAPVYFNTLSEGSSISNEFNQNSKTSEANMSYGISASYAVNHKLSIRSGVNKVNLGYNTNDVLVFETLAKSSTSSILSGNVSSQKKTPSNINTSENVGFLSATSFESGRTPETFTPTSVNQSISYIEVPVEIQYTVLDRRLGLNLIGGFSSFFLSGNELSTGDQSTLPYMEANNINDVSYSANLGLGFQYKFSEKLNLNLEPMFKYQINTFNNTSGNFTPYFIGVYTGIGFKF
ncbi:hypothetical protein ACFFU9_00500 [Mariniflexile ostreae]|uniref:Outer membrane protein beta-barrel domain-containing protein n=1 Tax=Mariniflexile ostreae TaxID=1520892 RepID=A0ABV5F6Y6_9FLAO